MYVVRLPHTNAIGRWTVLHNGTDSCSGTLHCRVTGKFGAIVMFCAYCKNWWILAQTFTPCHRHYKYLETCLLCHLVTPQTIHTPLHSNVIHCSLSSCPKCSPQVHPLWQPLSQLLQIPHAAQLRHKDEAWTGECWLQEHCRSPMQGMYRSMQYSSIYVIDWCRVASGASNCSVHFWA